MLEEIQDVVEEISNKNAVIASTQRDLITGGVSKDLARRLLLPPIFNCCLISIGDMLDNDYHNKDLRLFRSIVKMQEVKSRVLYI